MKKLFVLILAIGNFAIAAPTTFNLKMDLEIDGLKESSPHLVIETEKKKLVESFNSDGDGYFVELIAKEISDSVVKMNFVVGEVFMGERFIISAPSIATNYGEEAQITVGDDDGEEEFSLSVVATEKSN